MRSAVIVQQRLRNTRLPRKGTNALFYGDGSITSVTTETLRRCKQIKNADLVVLAVPEGVDDDLWEVEARVSGAEFFRGPEADVLRRYRLAADAYNVGAVLRVTADCPLLNTHECERVLDKVLSGDHDFAANSGPGSFSLGWSCEAFTADLLRQADDTSTDPIAREHVGPGPRSLAKAPEYIVIPEDGADMRPSIDTWEDYLAIRRIFQHQIREAA
jgi:spore coat polysaccharide biosynthesis protein SpsF